MNTEFDNEIIHAMAKIDGFTLLTLEGQILLGYKESRCLGMHVMVPNYLKDLNALHEVETLLEDKTRKRPLYTAYTKELSKLCDNNLGLIVHATARQRCKAILKTFNKWDSKWDL